MAASEYPHRVHMTKYQKIRREWTQLFKNEKRQKLRIVEDFFYDFHRNHQQFEFTIAKIYDGSKQVLVDKEGLMQIKEELERKIGETLPEVPDLTFLNGINYTFVERRSFASWREFRNYSDKLERENDKEKRRRAEQASSQARELRQTITAKPRNVFLVFDIEVYRYDAKLLLEIGFVKFGVHADVPKEYFHYIVKENLQYVNDEEFNSRDNFHHGTSEKLSQKDALSKFQEHLNNADSLVVHAGSNDVGFLGIQGVTLPAKQMFDTQVLANALLPSGSQARSLKRIMDDLGVSYDESKMHNAGNDAAMTMHAFCALAKKV